jgi:hypothetical protein
MDKHGRSVASVSQVAFSLIWFRKRICCRIDGPGIGHESPPGIGPGLTLMRRNAGSINNSARKERTVVLF